MIAHGNESVPDVPWPCFRVIIQMIVELVHVPETEQLTLRAAQVIDNMARVEGSRELLGGLGAVQYLVRLLGG